MKRTGVALIDEPRCIGCTRCIEACPVDAISGALGYMHAVIADWCTGCELCVPACPVDCIDMVSAQSAWTADDATLAKARARRRKARLAMERPVAADRKAVIARMLGRK